MTAFALLAGRVTALQDTSNPGILVSENLLEVRTMLATRTEEWKQRWLQQGIEHGIQQGMQQGLVQGEAIMLHRLLESRFGPLPDWARERIATADTETLETWGLRILQAQSIDEALD